MTIGKALKELRTNLDKSQQEVADKIEISRSVLSQYENNLVEPTANVVKKFAVYFEVSADYLLGLEDDFGVRTATPVDNDLSSEEREIIKKYRELNVPGKNLVKTVIDTHLATMADSIQNKNHHKKA